MRSISTNCVIKWLFSWCVMMFALIAGGKNIGVGREFLASYATETHTYFAGGYHLLAGAMLWLLALLIAMKMMEAP